MKDAPELSNPDLSNPDRGTRHVYGPRPLGALVPALMRPAFKKRSPAASQVMADWAAIVGEKLALVTTPRKLAAGTLSIACAGPMALELQHLSDALIGRINTHVGRDLVQRLRFLQEPLATRPAPVLRPAPDPVAASLAAAAVADLPPGELRDALASLGRAVLTRRRP